MISARMVADSIVVFRIICFFLVLLSIVLIYVLELFLYVVSLNIRLLAVSIAPNVLFSTRKEHFLLMIIIFIPCLNVFILVTFSSLGTECLASFYRSRVPLFYSMFSIVPLFFFYLSSLLKNDCYSLLCTYSLVYFF